MQLHMWRQPVWMREERIDLARGLLPRWVKVVWWATVVALVIGGAL